MARYRCAPLLAVVLSLCSITAVAGEPGYFGFQPSAKLSGFKLNPTIDSVLIAKVLPGTPAARAGILAGDAVVRIDGVELAGKKALKMMGMAKREVGQTLRVDLKRPNGQLYTVALVAEAKH